MHSHLTRLQPRAQYDKVVSHVTDNASFAALAYGISRFLPLIIRKTTVEMGKRHRPSLHHDREIKPFQSLFIYVLYLATG